MYKFNRTVILKNGECVFFYNCNKKLDLKIEVYKELKNKYNI